MLRELMRNKSLFLYAAIFSILASANYITATGTCYTTNNGTFTFFLTYSSTYKCSAYTTYNGSFRCFTHAFLFSRLRLSRRGYIMNFFFNYNRFLLFSCG